MCKCCKTNDSGFRKHKAICLSEEKVSHLTDFNQLKMNRESKTLWSTALKV